MRIKFFPFFTIKQYERGISERLGKFHRFATPGFHVQIPIFEVTRIRDIREHTMSIEPQNVITKDNVEIEVDGIIWANPGLEVEDIKKTFYNIDNWKRAVVQLAQTNLRQEFGKISLDESLVARETIAANLKSSLDKLTENWGLKVSKVEIKLIDPPNDIKVAMHKEKSAEQERRAMKTLAMGRFEAAEQEKLAALQKAEGEKAAAIMVAEGKAQAIKLVNEAADKYFTGNAKDLKIFEATESSLKDNTKVVLTEQGIKPSIILGDIPFQIKNEKGKDNMKL